MASFFTFTDLADHYYSTGGVPAPKPRPHYRLQPVSGSWKVSDEEAKKYYYNLSDGLFYKFAAIVESAAHREGCANIRPGGATWQRIARKAIDDFIIHEIEIGEIELDVQ